MRKAGIEQFSYETFVAAHETDTRLQNLVTNFDKDKIELKQSEVDDLKSVDQGADDISAMAKRATDVGADL